MDTLKYIKQKYKLRYLASMPITLPIERNKGFTALCNELGFTVGAEIGTAHGRYAWWLLEKINGLKLYSVDPWAVYPRYPTQLHDAAGQKIYDDMFEQAKRKLAGRNVEFVKKYSMNAIKDFEDESLDFVYIDANHTFEFVINDIAEWERKVRRGGIVAGHDYWNSSRRKMKYCQVKDAIDAWTTTNRIKPWFITKEVNGENQGESWFYVKQ